MVIRPKFICVTSNFDICELYTGPVLSALQARFDVLRYVDGAVQVQRKPVFEPSDRFLTALNDVVPQEADVVDVSAPSVSSKKTLAEEALLSDSDFEDPVKKKKGKL